MHLLSRGLYQAGAWPALYAGETKRLHGAVARVYRRFVSALNIGDDAIHMPGTAFYAVTGFMAPAMLIHYITGAVQPTHKLEPLTETA